MKIFTNRSITKKILIVILTIMLLTFSIPKPVNADWGGILVSPLTSLSTSVIDTVQYLLEWTMLGRANYFMDQTLDEAPASTIKNEDGTERLREPDEATIKVTQKIDGSFGGFDKTNVPDIRYTPENIFANRIPALDVNFIKPSVKTGNSDWDNEHNIAIRLQPIISSWYIAIRTLALVGLLSVLVYLGIRMLLTSVAADRAKYKKMIMDWIVAICLLFVLHYIMSFALTMAEVVTSMISSQDTDKMVSVYVEQEGKTFDMSLMNYVRFMIQCTDFKEKMAFLFLYLMLMIYTVRFTWTYLKRVVNMAFLTLIAPAVALTYPIDKVSDGKAQAFNMWIKEFAFNALLQPLHLLLYTVLLSSAVELAMINPLYAIVCLAFILSGEKLLKKMFGFDKASAGTLGSLAGAAGVSAFAANQLMNMAKKPHGGNGGGNGKVRTKDQYTREGRNSGLPKGYQSFDRENNQGQAQLDAGNDGNGNTPPPTGGNGERRNTPPPAGENDERGNTPPPAGENDGGENTLPPAGENDSQPLSIDEQIAQEKANMSVQDYRESGMSPSEWEEQRRAELEEQQAADNSVDTQEVPDTSGSPNPEMTEEALQGLGEGDNKPETWRDIRDRDREKADRNRKEKAEARKERLHQGWKDIKSGETLRKGKIAGYKTLRGVRAALPTLGYKAVRGTLKTASRAAAGIALAATAGVIGATTGDGDKAMSMAAAGLGVGFATGDNMFEGTLGKAMKDKSVKDSFGAGKYGSAIDARNAKADKAYLKSAEHSEEFEKYWKGKMSKQDYDKAVKDYREAGFTDTKTIRKALRLEEKYKNDPRHTEDIATRRQNIQGIIQTHDSISKKAIYGEDANATKAALKYIESQITSGDAKQKRAIANQILQEHRDWHNI